MHPHARSRLIRVANWLTAAALCCVSHTAIAQTTKIVAKGETLRIQIYPGTIGSGHPVLWVALDKGFCEAHNIKCQLVEIPSGALGLQTLVSGSIDLSYATTDVAMQAMARGADIQLIASTHPDLYLTLNVHKRVDLPNRAKGYPAVMADLKGKKVGVSARGAATEIQMRALLLGAGMKAEDVTFVAVGSPATAYQAMMTGQVDAVMSWAPIETVCQLTESCIVLVDPRKGEGPPDLKALNGAAQELSANRKFIEANPVLIDAFIQVIEESAQWVKDPKNYPELLAITKKRFSLGDVPNADAGVESLLKNEVAKVGANLDRRSVQAFADFLLKYQLVDKPLDVSRFVYQNAPGQR